MTCKTYIKSIFKKFVFNKARWVFSDTQMYLFVKFLNVLDLQHALETAAQTI